MEVTIPILSPGAYGAATPALQSILDSARRLRWFPVLPSGDPPDAVREATRNHLTRLSELFPAKPPFGNAPIRWIRGDLAAFDRVTPAITETEGWGDPMGPTPWGQLLTQLSLDVRKTIEATPDLIALVGPPLWPVRLSLGIVGSAIFDTPPPKELQPDPRWAMLSHVEYNFHRTLDWALALPATVVGSPFHHLWEVHLAGYYPLGLVDGEFVVFSRDS
jgi:hypothetical protein